MMSTLKDGIDNVVITFDNPYSEFIAGTPMTGNILVVMEETTAVRGIRLKVMGDMVINWTKTDGERQSKYIELDNGWWYA